MSVSYIKTGNMSLVVISEKQYAMAIAAGNAAGKVKVGKIDALVVYPNGTSAADIKGLIEAAGDAVAN